MRIADFETCLPEAFARPLAPSAAAAPASWFDEAAAPAPSICADVAPAARGLSVAQHAERVLALLCSAGTEGP